MRYGLFAASVALLLCGCFGDAVHRPAAAGFDFTASQATPDSGRPPRLILRRIEVHAPSWLESPAMQYILAYADASRREAYAESRWVAPPARLLENFLARHLFSGKSETPSVGCRLRVELDEFVQAYDATEHSRALLEARVMLLPPHGDVILLRRSFRQSPPAGANAHSGVLAFSEASRKLGADIESWLNQTADATPALVERCRAG